MATSSFFRDIELKTPKQVRKLLRALEQSKNARSKEVNLRGRVHEVKREQVKAIFDKIKW